MKCFLVAVAVALSAASLLLAVPAHAQWRPNSYTFNITESPNGPSVIKGPSSSSVSCSSQTSGGGKADQTYSGTVVTKYYWAGYGSAAPARQDVDQVVSASGYADTASNSLGSSAAADCGGRAYPTYPYITASGSAASASFQVQDDPLESFNDTKTGSHYAPTSGAFLNLTLSVSSSIHLNTINNANGAVSTSVLLT